MKTSRVVLAAAAILLIGQPAIANDQGEEDQVSAEQKPMMMQQMHERMQMMHEQMEKIHATEDPEERKRLMHEHMQNMRSAMTMMGKMDGPMMGSGHMGGAGEEHQHQMQKCTDDTAQCQQMNKMAEHQGQMEQRMQMMQMMMQQMMEREAVEHDHKQ